MTEGTKEQDRGIGKMGYRAAWIALPLGLLNVALASLALLFAALNDYSLIYLLEDYLLPGAILAVSVSVVGALVASHRPRNPLGWIFLTVGFFQGLVQFAWTYAEYALITEPDSLPGGPLMSWLGGVAWIPSVSLFLTFALLLFPDGRLPSPRWRPVAWLSVVPLAIFVVDMVWLWPYRGRTLIERPGQVVPDGLIGVLLNMLFPLMVLCGVACVISLMVRFWYSQGIERQQIKWFAYAAAIFLTANVSLEYLYLGPIMFLMALPIVPVVPVALGVAILRYRLYEIDIIINRTLVYGMLTVLLAAGYFATIMAFQGIGSLVYQVPFRALFGQESALATVAATLAMAALFNPLRRRIQSFIDRRFYRSKYDAAKTLEAFSVKLRDEEDLQTLNNDLVGVVRETVQPAHVSLWLRSDTAPQRQRPG